MKKAINNFEKYLYVWVFVCMLVGILFSHYLPRLSVLLNSWQIGNVSVPIGICLFLMMYPALLNLQIKEVKKLIKAPKPIVLTLFSNWIIAPIVTVILANMFLKGYDQLIVALVLLGSSPCTAMVIVWGSLAKGNQEQNVITTSINTLTIMFLYAPVVALLTGLQGITLDRYALLISVLFFIGLPLIVGYISKKLLIAKKGLKWFETTYKPTVGKISIAALLFTLIVLFTLNGDILLKNPGEMLLVSVPLLLGFIIVVATNIFITKLFKLEYEEAIISVIIGSSGHFEIAIATAITLFGLGSQAALGTTMGLFWEVPIMLGLVYLGKFLHRKDFWVTKEYKRETLLAWGGDDHEWKKLEPGLNFVMTETPALAIRLRNLAARKNHDKHFFAGTMAENQLYTRFKRTMQPYKTYPTVETPKLKALRSLLVTGIYRPASPGPDVAPVFRDIDKDLRELDQVLAERARTGD